MVNFSNQFIVQQPCSSKRLSTGEHPSIRTSVGCSAARLAISALQLCWIRHVSLPSKSSLFDGVVASFVSSRPQRTGTAHSFATKPNRLPLCKSIAMQLQQLKVFRRRNRKLLRGMDSEKDVIIIACDVRTRRVDSRWIFNGNILVGEDSRETKLRPEL